MAHDPAPAVSGDDLVSEGLRSLAHVSIVIFDVEMRVQGLHGGALERHGYLPEVIVGRRAPDVVPASAWAHLGPLYAEALAGNTITARVPSADGTAIYETTFQPVLRDGEIIGGMAASRDITDAVRADEARAEAERRLEATARDFRMLADSSTDAIIRARPGELLYASPAAEKILGLRPDEHDIVERFWAAIHPDDLALAHRAREEIYAGGEPRRIECRLRHTSGEWRWLEVDLRGLREEESGGILELHGAIRDITRRKHGEELARLWHLSWDASPRGMAIIEPDRTLRAVNPAFAVMHGGQPEDFEGAPLEAVLTPEAAALVEQRAEIVDRDGSLDFESVHRSRDGRIFPVAVEIVGIRDAHGKIVQRVAVYTDVTEKHAQREAERHANELFERSFTEAPVGILIVRDGVVQRANAALGDILGSVPSSLIGRAAASLVHPDDRAASADAVRRTTAGETLPPTDRRVLRADGTTRTVTLRYSILPEDDGPPIVLMHVTDRTAEHAIEQERQRVLSLFEATFARAPIGLCLVAPDGRFLRVNDALCALLGRTEAQLLSSGFQELTHPDDLALDLALLDDTLHGRRDGYEIEKRYLRPDGRAIDARLAVSAVAGADGTPEFLISQLVDLTELKRVEAQLKHAADHDELTGLFTRRRLSVELDREVVRMRRHGGCATLLLLDLDGFKEINDRFGHSAGDELLRELSTHLRGLLRESDVIGRIGGDEFAILLPDTRLDGARNAAVKLLATVRTRGRVERDGVRAGVTASIGATILDGAETLDPEALLVEADIAMYRAKAAGKDQLVVFGETA